MNEEMGMSTPVMKLFDLSGQVALITGGSRGLGLQIAEALGEAGAKVMLSARKQGELEEAVAHLQSRGIDARWVAGDGSDPKDIERVADEAQQRLGPVDILVNNAGATWGAPAEDYPLSAWDKVMDLNIRGVFLMSQAVGRMSMIPRRRGRIINIASIAGLSGSHERIKFIAYGTSKGAVVNFTRTLAGEWGHHGITVNALAPGFFPSKMTKGVLAEHGADTLAQQAPLKRIGDDNDLKGAALLFASEAGKHITGQILAVDGGVSAIHGG
jgi:gluconate 5-dehydrogenase